MQLASFLAYGSPQIMHMDVTLHTVIVCRFKIVQFAKLVSANNSDLERIIGYIYSRVSVPLHQQLRPLIVFTATECSCTYLHPSTNHNHIQNSLLSIKSLRAMRLIIIIAGDNLRVEKFLQYWQVMTQNTYYACKVLSVAPCIPGLSLTQYVVLS